MEVAEISTAFRDFQERATAKLQKLEEDQKRVLDHNEKLMARLEESRAFDGAGEPRELRESKAALLETMRGNAVLERRDLTTSPGSEGGYMVPEAIDRVILNQQVDISPVRRVAMVQQISTPDYFKLINRRGFSSGWTHEHGARTVTDTADLAMISPKMGELYARPKVSNHLLQDAMFSIDAFLDENVSTEFAFQEGSAFVSGDGIAKPFGILSSATATDDDTSRTFGTLQYLANGSTSTIDSEKLIDLLYLLRPSYRQGPGVAWMMNSTTAGHIRKLKDGNGQWLWQNSMIIGQPSTLLGYPVVEAEDMPDIASDAFPLAFGNFRRGYLIVDRIGTVMIRDPYTTKGFTEFYFARRTGGVPMDSNAIKLLKMAAS